MAAAAEVAVEDEKAASSAVARAVEGESAVSAEGKLLQSELKLLNVPPVVLLVHESIGTAFVYFGTSYGYDWDYATILKIGQLGSDFDLILILIFERRR